MIEELTKWWCRHPISRGIRNFCTTFPPEGLLPPGILWPSSVIFLSPSVVFNSILKENHQTIKILLTTTPWGDYWFENVYLCFISPWLCDFLEGSIENAWQVTRSFETSGLTIQFNLQIVFLVLFVHFCCTTLIFVCELIDNQVVSSDYDIQSFNINMSTLWSITRKILGQNLNQYDIERFDVALRWMSPNHKGREWNTGRDCICDEFT